MDMKLQVARDRTHLSVGTEVSPLPLKFFGEINE
tara:strand:+ start:910 stop:1011 length:102 start_codon:yes stop_codon:yes gene_type:complete